MTTHIALEEGRDIEEVAQWSARRRLLHAQMIGSLNQYKQQQAEADSGEYQQAGMGDMQGVAQDVQTPGQMAHGQGQGADLPGTAKPTTPGMDPTTRHANQLTVADEDTEWEFCEQCRGLFEPGEFEAHFSQPGFDCVQ